ncbi:fimbrial protein [Acinetobacter nematophilus]|uniref:fimbrial protein n=1 Tax=Acinetobacter TaxID=469 RepID=UPI00258B8158|nr:fimbrial protein [Acinetobacter sp.]
MKIKLLVSTLLVVASAKAGAVVCWNSKGQGVVDEVFYDLTNTFTSSNNTAGKIIELQKNFSEQVYAVCPKHSASSSNNRTWRSYVTSLPVLETIDRYQYLPINDYLIGAMKITDSAAGTFYPPVNYVHMGTHPNVSKGDPFPVKDSNFTFRIKVIRSFVSFVPIPRRTMFTVYVTTANGEPLNMPVYNISYSGSITVPQSCEIGAGNTLEIDFGNIAANAFSQAGVGNKPSSAKVETRTFPIQCTNIDGQALLSLRVEAEQATGDMIQSDNPDVGFKMADQDSRVLLPNNINSYIPFRNADPAYVTIKAWPVSTTNKTPAPGPFRARGYLRVDFN